VTEDVPQIHPNTLNNQLERIEGILGANLEDAAWIAKLHVALRLRQASLAENSGRP
jgi:DNA-binding PucR family transcriptional regulator